MVRNVYPSQLEDEDIIAVYVMNEKDLRYFNSLSKSFGRLTTRKLMQDLKGVRKKLPVYKNAVPLALFTLIGGVISLLFGNVLLYVI